MPKEKEIEETKKTNNIQCMRKLKEKVFDTFSLNLSGFFSVFSHTTSGERSENKDKKFIHTLLDCTLEYVHLFKETAHI